MTDEAQEAHEDELAERDRIGEKSPAEDACFGGRAESDPYAVGPAAMSLTDRMRWIAGLPVASLRRRR